MCLVDGPSQRSQFVQDGVEPAGLPSGSDGCRATSRDPVRPSGCVENHASEAGTA
jgi:hypothetical protein